MTWATNHSDAFPAHDKDGNVEALMHDDICPLCREDIFWIKFVGEQHKDTFRHERWLATCDLCDIDFIDPVGDGGFTFLEDHHMPDLNPAPVIPPYKE